MKIENTKIDSLISVSKIMDLIECLVDSNEIKVEVDYDSIKIQIRIKPVEDPTDNNCISINFYSSSISISSCERRQVQYGDGSDEYFKCDYSMKIDIMYEKETEVEALCHIIGNMTFIPNQYKEIICQKANSMKHIYVNRSCKPYKQPISKTIRNKMKDAFDRYDEHNSDGDLLSVFDRCLVITNIYDQSFEDPTKFILLSDLIYSLQGVLNEEGDGMVQLQHSSEYPPELHTVRVNHKDSPNGPVKIYTLGDK